MTAVLGNPVAEAAYATRVAAIEREKSALAERVGVLEAEKSALALSVQEAHERLERIHDESCEWADRNNLCSQFEAFWEEQGFTGRRRDYEATVEITLRVSMSVSDMPRNSDSEDIERELRSSYTDEELMSLVIERRAEIDVDRFDVTDYEEAC